MPVGLDQVHRIDRMVAVRPPNLKVKMGRSRTTRVIQPVA